LKKGSYDWLLRTLCWLVYGKADNACEYLMQRLYQVHGDIFKLNLFPLACRRDSQEHWSREHQHSGCALRSDYVRQIEEHRAISLPGGERLLGSALPLELPRGEASKMEVEPLEPYLPAAVAFDLDLQLSVILGDRHPTH
jgi:hypothetical protein